jgi:hypothetical protein
MADAAFNWDDHPIEKSDSSGSFNWDDHPIDQSYKDSLGYKALGYLPAAGMAAGGLAGAAGSMGLASIPLAGIGGVGGKAVEQVLKQKIYGEDPGSYEKVYKDQAGSGINSMEAEMGGQMLPAIANDPNVLGGIKNYGTKIIEGSTGVPIELIKAYKNDRDALVNMKNQSGGNPAIASEQIKNKWGNIIQDTKDVANNEISQGLKESNKSIKVDDVVKNLNNIRDQLKPDIHSQDIAQIDHIVNTIKNRTYGEPGNTYLANVRGTPAQAPGKPGEPGTYLSKPGEPGNTYLANVRGTPAQLPRSTSDRMPIQDANELKRWLQSLIDTHYAKPGEIFNHGGPGIEAAKDTARELRLRVADAEPRVANGLSSLQKLHEIDNDIKGNLLNPAASEKSLINVGNNKDQAGIRDLSRLGNIIGHDTVGDAQKLAAAKEFGFMNGPTNKVSTQDLVQAVPKTAMKLGTFTAGKLGKYIPNGIPSSLARGYLSPDANK